MPPKAVIARLEGLLKRHQRQVDDLLAEQRALRHRAVAVELAHASASALLELSRALAAPDAPPTAGGAAAAGAFARGASSTARPAGPGGGSGAASSAPAPPAQLRPWQAALVEMVAELGGSGGEEAGNSDGEGSACPSGGPQPSGASAALDAADSASPVAAPPLCWSPPPALARRGGEALTTAGLRRTLRGAVLEAGGLLASAQGGPDGGAALEALEALRRRVSEAVALHAVVSPESQAALSEVLLARLDAPDDGGGGGGPPGGSSLGVGAVSCAWQPASQPPQLGPAPEQLSFASSQLSLTEDQELRVIPLLTLSRGRISALLARRAALLATSGQSAHDAAAQEAVVQEIAAVQSRYQITSITFLLAFSSLITAPQLFAWLVASWPWSPSLAALHSTLLAQHEAAQREAARAAAAAPRGRGRPRKNPPPQPESPPPDGGAGWDGTGPAQ